MLKRYYLMLIALMFTFGSLLCGCESEKCYICKNEIKDGEHVLNSLYFPMEKVVGHKLSLDEDDRGTDDLVCENCQLKYLGIVRGHCMRCLTEFGENDNIYYGYEPGGDADGFDFGVCEQCATELWGNDKEQYAVHEWVCESCHISFGDDTHKNITASYESGICDNCYEQIFG